MVSYVKGFEPRSHFKSRLSLIVQVNVVLNRNSEDDYCTGCRNVSHCQQQQSYSGLRSPRQSNSTYLWLATFSIQVSRTLKYLLERVHDCLNLRVFFVQFYP